jgi:putative spermidine/putrescine transport system permease protein
MSPTVTCSPVAWTVRKMAAEVEFRTVGARFSRIFGSKTPLLWLLLPGLLGIGVSFVLPLIWLARMSLNKTGSAGELISTLTFDSYADALGDSFYWGIILNTLELGGLVSIVTVACAYPIALFLTRTTSRWKGLLIALAVVPLMTSSVARTFGWVALLGDRGIVNQTVISLGFTDVPLKLSNNFTGTVIALVEVLMPYAILVMLSGFGRLNSSLEEAAGSLGANKTRSFLRIVFPLTLPGVFIGFLLVFVLSISSFVTPRIMGGGRVFVLATEIYDEATQTLNWPLASALSIILIVIFGVMVMGYQKLSKKLGA